ncbi:hypothetical protein F4821DRAFT_258828 [Hypoxylon rubiginosum]|uniref:Uncharacterized protein n=1 Tax=Hypoxylon rubiginosum TaxID=110542 RepID=A0ACC0D452_9PEZI|nr:hypothetical protein F4821DRAFT_258828 [Hypoxylon rubiginosum]
MADQGSKRPNPFATDAKDSKRHHPDDGNIPPKNVAQFQGADVPPPSLFSSPAPTQTHSPSISNFGNATFRSFGSFGSIKLGLFGNAEISPVSEGLAKPSSQPVAGTTTLASNGSGGDKDNRNQQGVQDSPSSTHGGEVVFGKPSVLKPDQSVVRVHAELEQQKMELTALGSRTNTLETKNDCMEVSIHDIQKNIETNNASLRNEILQQVRAEMRREIFGLKLSALRPGTPAQVKAKDQDLVFLHEVKGTKTVGVKQEEGGDVVLPKKSTGHRNLLSFLKSVDLSPPNRIQTWVAAKSDPEFATADHVLWAWDADTAYIVRLNGKHPLVLSRSARGHGFREDGIMETMRWSELICYQDHLVEVNYRLPGPDAPVYAMIIGEIWTRRTRSMEMPPDYLSSNYYLVMDITKKERPLWIMYAYEYIPGEHIAAKRGSATINGDGKAEIVETRMYDFRRRNAFLGVKHFDVACLAPSLNDIIETNGGSDKGRKGDLQLDWSRVRESLNLTGHIHRPVFTRPSLGDLDHQLRLGGIIF